MSTRNNIKQARQIVGFSQETMANAKALYQPEIGSRVFVRELGQHFRVVASNSAGIPDEVDIFEGVGFDLVRDQIDLDDVVDLVNGGNLRDIIQGAITGLTTTPVTATAGQTSVPMNYTPNALVVVKNGSVIKDGFTASNGTSLEFNSPLNDGDIILGIGFPTLAVGVAEAANVNDNSRGQSVQETLDQHSTHEFVPDDGGVAGGFNVKSANPFSSIAPDVRVAYIAHGGRENFPNIIGSFAGTQAFYGTISGGYDNIVDTIAGTIAGGAHHRLHGDEPNTSHNTIGGGSFNEVERGEYTTIAGGTANIARKVRRDGTTPSIPTNSVISGGSGNQIRGGNSVIAGGLNNDCDGGTATIGGGSNNVSEGNFTTVAGGADNEARSGTLGAGQKNTISGGRSNVIDSSTNPVGSTISGGESNVVYGNYNVIAGGLRNEIGITATALSQCVIAGGLDNAITSGTGVSIIGGRDNTASADYASIIGGRDNTAPTVYSSAAGREAVARHASGHTIADGGFAVAGDAQTSLFVMKNTTTDATPTGLLKNAAQTVALPDDSTFLVEAFIVARRTDAAGESAAYKIECCIDRGTGAGSVAFVGAPIVTVIAEDAAAWDGTVSANVSQGGFNLTVTGEAGKTIRWVSKVRIVEVSG